VAEAGAKAFQVSYWSEYLRQTIVGSYRRTGKSRGTADRFSEVIAGIAEIRSVLVRAMPGNELSPVRTELAKLPMVRWQHPGPSNWQLLRDRGEYLHAASAVLDLVALITFVLALLKRSS
jgi:hypothetical protein